MLQPMFRVQHHLMLRVPHHLMHQVTHHLMLLAMHHLMRPAMPPRMHPHWHLLNRQRQRHLMHHRMLQVQHHLMHHLKLPLMHHRMLRVQHHLMLQHPLPHIMCVMMGNMDATQRMANAMSLKRILIAGHANASLGTSVLLVAILPILVMSVKPQKHQLRHHLMHLVTHQQMLLAMLHLMLLAMPPRMRPHWHLLNHQQ